MEDIGHLMSLFRFFLVVVLFGFSVENTHSQYLNFNGNKDLVNHPVFGINVSSEEGVIDWHQLRKQKNLKLNFIYLRATQGSDTIDESYQRNITEAKQYGFMVGSYHEFCDKALPEVQFHKFSMEVDKKKQNLRPAVYVGKNSECDNKSFHRNLQKFLTLIESNYKFRPIIYCQDQHYLDFIVKDFPDYQAMLFNSTDSQPKGYSEKALSFLHTDSGNIPGIQDKVDIHRLNTDQYSLMNMTVYNIWGIDVSHYQANIDWNQLLENKPHFIFLKATEGASLKDKRYIEYYERSKAMGITTGAYHFFSFRSTGAAQAKHFIETVKLKPGDFPPVLDFELTRYMPKDKWKVTRELLSWIQIIEGHYGVKPIIYTPHFLYSKYLASYLKPDYPLWICDYFKVPICDWTFWQSTDKHRVSGIRSSVDFNLFSGTREEFENLKMK